MSLQTKIKWLLRGSGITTYRIAKDINENVQTLDVYKNDLEKIKGMALERAEKLGEYIDNLSLEDIYKKKLSNAQIIIANASEDEIKEFFSKYDTATALKWIKPYKDKFIVNFDIYSQKKFRKNEHELYELEDSISTLNHELLQKKAKYIMACGESVNFGGSKTLYKLNGKSYQVVSVINAPGSLKAVDFIRIVETDEWKAEYEPKLDDDFFNQPIDW